MSDNTQGIDLRRGPKALRAAVELLSSMRFAIALLALICIAAVIGTVLKQHEPTLNYVNQFGPFWAALFATLGLNAVYGAWWFLLLLAALVLSTSLCIARNTPKILADLASCKENIRTQSLQAFHHKAQALLPGAPGCQARRIAGLLAGSGWKVRLQRRAGAPDGADASAAGPDAQAPGAHATAPPDADDGAGWMVAARAGAANKLGYLAAHGAIVLVCLGGLLDGDLIVRAQMLLGGKTPYQGGGLIADVPAAHRLSQRNPAFRGNLFVAEGARAATAVLPQSDGVLLQDLPFAIELKKFIVEHYSSGMPKLFASEIVIHDKATGAQTPARVEVNHPVSYQGIQIYQASFDDGGSLLKLRARPMAPGARPFDLQGVVGGVTELGKRADPGATAARNAGQAGQADSAGQALTLELTALRTINVENFGASGAGDASAAADPGGEEDAGAAAAQARSGDLLRQARQALDARLGAANKAAGKKTLRNVGPSLTYKLRDAAGQAREFHNYMLPVDLGDGVPVFLLGVREAQAQTFRYLRVPADEQGSMDGFMRLRDALADPAARLQAVQRYAQQAAARSDLAGQLQQSALRALTLFAGQGRVAGVAGAGPGGGLQAVADFLQTHVPEAERARAGQMLLRILNGSLFELAQLARARAGLAPLAQDEHTRGFLAQAVLALSDAQHYPAPLLFELTDFTQVQASVFQVARAPGQYIVYLGCGLLILGVFAMLYVRERRLWVWLAPCGAHSQATLALSSNRRTMETDQEFSRLARQLTGADRSSAGGAAPPEGSST